MPHDSPYHPPSQPYQGYTYEDRRVFAVNPYTHRTPYPEPEPIRRRNTYYDPYDGHSDDVSYDARAAEGFEDYGSKRGECFNLSKSKLAGQPLSLLKISYVRVNKS